MSRVITVENLGKKYVLGHQARQESYLALRDVIADTCKSLGSKVLNPFSSRKATSAPTKEEFWALRDVSFEVNQGDRIGIIGRNGAGKSTLLKILSRITEPSTGSVRIRGRVASLLEVGTGFHPELTGRENIFLNGAILGMAQSEIKKKFDEIVDFAEVERFLDTPVKRYSSGMYVRLAFAVAAHLEPEILMVDEVLAVGDLHFQKKCLGKMEDVSSQGRTVLFVSHNMGAVTHLCSKALLLESGSVKCAGEVAEVIDQYYAKVKETSQLDLEAFSGFRRGSREFAEIKRISVQEAFGHPQTVFGMGETVVIRLSIDIKQAIRGSVFGVMLRNSMGALIHDFRSSFDGFFPDFSPGLQEISVVIPRISVYPGSYTVGAWIQRQVGIASDDYVNEVLKITIADKKILGDPRANFEIISKEGTEVYHPCQWHLE